MTEIGEYILFMLCFSGEGGWWLKYLHLDDLVGNYISVSIAEADSRFFLLLFFQAVYVKWFK